MGNFYVNHTVRSTDQAAVVKALTGRSAFVSPVSNGACVVFDEEADTQDPSPIMEVGGRLSKEIGVPVLAVQNHDDDILWYGLFEKGRLVDEYTSDPGYFEGADRPPEGGDAAKLCAAFDRANVDEVDAILRKVPADENEGYVFAFERHADLVKALSLPSFAVSCGFGYISAGEMPEGLSQADLVRVPGP